MALIFLCNAILTVVFSSMTSHATVSRTFKVKVNTTGSQMCAVDKPSTVIAMAASTMVGQCGVKCNVDPACELFQFKEDLAQCELFNYSPSNFSSINHCTAFGAPPGIQSCSLVTSWSVDNHVLATATLNGQLFVTYYSIAQVSVYDTVTFQRLRQITFPAFGTFLRGLATSVINNYLYISDNNNKCMHRVDLSVTSTVSVLTWNASGTPLGLSVTSVGNVLVVTASKNIREYTPNGSLVRAITNSNFLFQAVEVNNDIWAFTLIGPMNGICTTLTNGTLIKCFTGSEAASGITQMSRPRSLAIGPRGDILVADYDNNRILIVKPSLTEARQLLLLPINTGVISLTALTFDESRGRLYTGENDGQSRVLVFDGIW